MSGSQLTEDGRRQLILIGKALEHLVLTEATDEGGSTEPIQEAAITEAFERLATNGFSQLTNRVNQSEERSKAYRLDMAEKGVSPHHFNTQATPSEINHGRAL